MSWQGYSRKGRALRWPVIAGALLALALVYFIVDPSNHLFPKCPFLMLTGWQCPGCGSQRAVHYLLNGHFAAAWQMNPLLLVAIPYLITGFVVEFLHKKYAWAETVRQKLYGTTAAWTVLGLIIIFTILRNII